jgi:hypothetical protein
LFHGKINAKEYPRAYLLLPGINLKTSDEIRLTATTTDTIPHTTTEFPGRGVVYFRR